MTQEQISRLLDDELSLGETQAVFTHLGACAPCALFYAQASAIGKRMRQTSAPDFPHALDERMRRAFAARALPARGPRRAMMPDRLRSFVRRRVVLPIPVAVAVLIASLGLSIFLLRSFAPELLPSEQVTKIVVAYPAVEVIADQSVAD